jgi:hypothetical protein
MGGRVRYYFCLPRDTQARADLQLTLDTYEEQAFENFSIYEAMVFPKKNKASKQQAKETSNGKTVQKTDVRNGRAL